MAALILLYLKHHISIGCGAISNVEHCRTHANHSMAFPQVPFSFPFQLTFEPRAHNYHHHRQ